MNEQCTIVDTFSKDQHTECTIPPLNTPTFTPTKQKVCAVVNKRSRECNARGGEVKCCLAGLVCHRYQSIEKLVR